MRYDIFQVSFLSTLFYVLVIMEVWMQAHITKFEMSLLAYFDKKESHSFGLLSVKEWNTMFYKHLDHHLNQFGV